MVHANRNIAALCDMVLNCFVGRLIFVCDVGKQRNESE